MRRYLVVAHRTLGGSHLLDELRRRLDEEESGEVHVLVPVHHPSNHPWTEHEVEAEAGRVLTQGMAQIEALGASVTGEVGDANPVYAVDAVLRNQRFDEIIVSTLPAGASRWLKLDVPSRLKRQFKIPITHVIAESETVG